VRQKLQPGVELDLLTESELERTLQEVLRGFTHQPAQVRAIANGKINGAGDPLILPIYDVPVGMGFFLTRLLVRMDAVSVAIPFTAAGAMLEVLRNDLVVDFKSLVAGAAVPAGLPALFTYGADAAEWFANGDVVAIRVTAPTGANQNIVASIKGILSPVVVGN
jgi:hypothetical protein